MINSVFFALLYTSLIMADQWNYLYQTAIDPQTYWKWFMILEALLYLYGFLWLVLKTPLIAIVMRPICWIATTIGVLFAFYLGFLFVISTDSTEVIKVFNLLKNIMGPIGFMGAAINASLMSSIS